MERNSALARAVVAEDHGLGVPEFGRHLLSLDRGIHIAELRVHVGKTLVAYRALVRHPHVLLIALLMYTMTARHEHYGLGRREHVVPADGAVAVCRSLDALVRRLHRHGYAGTASLSLLDETRSARDNLPCSGQSLCPIPCPYGKSHSRCSGRWAW